MGALGLALKGATLLGGLSSIPIGINAIEDYKESVKERAFKGYTPRKGFTTDRLGSKLILAEDPNDPGYNDFLNEYGEYLIENSPVLREQKRLLQGKFTFDPSKGLDENINQNYQAARLAEQEENQTLEKGTLTYKQQAEKDRIEMERYKADQEKDRKQYQDNLRIAEQARLDALESQQNTLQFQMLQAQRENDRYYDRLDREDAQLRREGYQSLGTGLAALAAAFTIV
tara:strand:+ start:82 stop:768 length:687 start_codon:yes stop_codon:yes gene_type:complete